MKRAYLRVSVWQNVDSNSIRTQHGRKKVASTDAIMDFILRRFQNQPLIPNHNFTGSIRCPWEPINQPTRNRKLPNLMTDAHQISTNVFRLWQEDKKGHKFSERRTKKREEAAQTQRDTKIVPPGRRRFVQKALRNNCRYTGRSERDCRHRKNRASPYPKTPYNQLNPEDNCGFRRKFKRTKQLQYPADSLHGTNEARISSADELDQVYSWNWISHASVNRKSSRVPTMLYLNRPARKTSFN